MRLGQLARKLALRPDQIVEFLAKKNIQIVEGSNTRLEDHQVALVVEKFAPQGFDITIPELASQADIQETEAQAMPPVPPGEATVQDSVPETTSREEKEIIKAAKVELSGLKVLGKIDLPEPKKKEPPKAELQPDAEVENKPKTPERPRSLQNRNPKANPRPTKNPVALQREREELEAQRKREAAKALEREKRAQHYFNKVKVVTPVKAAKRDQIEEQAEIEESAPRPRTLLGRFFRWFTT